MDLTDTTNLANYTVKDGSRFIFQLASWRGKAKITLKDCTNNEEIEMSVDAAKQLIDGLQQMLRHTHESRLGVVPIDPEPRQLNAESSLEAEPLMMAEADPEQWR